MAHFALLWKARTIEKYRQNYENEKYLSIQDTNIQMPRKSLSQRIRCYRQDTQKRFSKIFQKMYPEGSSLSNFFLYLKTDQTCLHLVLKSLLGFLIGLGLTYLCFLFLVFQLSISLFHATIVSSIIGVLLTMGLAFSYRIRCLIFLLIPQFFSRAGRYTLTCYALVLILTGPATNTLKNSEVLTESMACRQEKIKTLLDEVKDTVRRPLNALRFSIKTMVQKIHLFARELKQTLLKVNRLTLSVLETIQSSFSWLQWLSGVCNKVMSSPFERCLKVLREGAFDYKRRFEMNKPQIRRMVNKFEELCSNVKHYKAICVFTDFVNGSFVASIRRRLKDYAERIKNLLYLQIHVHHSYSFSSNTSHSPSQVAAGIVTEIRKRADPLLTWLSWSSCVTSLFLLLIIFRAKHYQHMFETRLRFDNKYITKELRDLDLNRLRHGRETILPLNKRERSKYVSTTSFRLVASEKIHLNRSIVFMAITTFKLLIHMVADYSLYWVLMIIRYHGKKQTALPLYWCPFCDSSYIPVGVPDAGMHITGTGRIADLFRSLLSALTSSLDRQQLSSTHCLPDPHPPNLQRYTQIGILIFLLWFFALFEPYGLRLRHVIMSLYRPERAKARAEWLYDHILRTRGGFMKFARRKLHRSYKYCSEEKHTLRRWLGDHIPFAWLSRLLGLSRDKARCLLCDGKQDPKDPNTKLQKCNTQGCPGIYCSSCFSDIGELCTICLPPREYGDLSDVSLERGSSDESDNDDSGGSNGGGVDKNDDEKNEQDNCDYDSEDILLPKPLRENNNDSHIVNNRDDGHNKTTFKNHTVDTKDEIYKVAKTFLRISFTKKQYLCNRKVIIKRFIIISVNPNGNICMNTSIRIHIMKITYTNINIYVPVDKRDEDSNKSSHKAKNNGQNEHKSKKSQNIPTSGYFGDNKNNRGQNSNIFNEKNIKNKGEEDNSDHEKEQDDLNNTEQEFACCSLKQFNAAFCSYWLNIKNNLFNSCNILTQTLINSTLGIDEKNNFKTRKKVPLKRLESKEFKSDTEDSREYRIFTFLAEQEWVIKKTIRYESTENEISLLNEIPDTATVEHLKEDLFSQTVHYKEISFTKRSNCNSPPNTSKEPKQNQSKRSDPPSCNLSMKQKVLFCEDCKYNCLCPGNPLNILSDLSLSDKNNQEQKCNERGIILTEITPPVKCKSACAGHKARKIGVMQKIKACLKCLFSRKPKIPKDCENTDDLKSHPVLIEVPGPKCLCEDRSIQFDENDCPYHNQSIQVKCRHNVTKITRVEKPKKTSKRSDKKPKKREREMKGECDPLCPTECDCEGHGVDPLMDGSCDALCPIDCDCHGQGIMEESCDPLCPIECQCNGCGIATKKCDELCPEECSCEEDLADDLVEKLNCCLKNSENARLLADHMQKLLKSACTNKQDTEDECPCCEKTSDNCCAEKTKKVDKKFCSCAIQCKPPECVKKECNSSSSCTSCSVSIISEETIRSDFTGTDNTCYSCYGCDYYAKLRKRRPRFVSNQSTGTDTAIKRTIGTITDRKGLVNTSKKNSRIYFTEHESGNNGNVKLVQHKFVENRGVCTKKLVSFRSRVHIIPSYSYEFDDSVSDSLDFYTPSRYLLESQKYYNELFAYMPYDIYPLDIIEERPYKRMSSQGSRSRYRKGGKAKRLERHSTIKREKIISKKRVTDSLLKHRKYYRKKNLSSSVKY